MVCCELGVKDSSSAWLHARCFHGRTVEGHLRRVKRPNHPRGCWKGWGRPGPGLFLLPPPYSQACWSRNSRSWTLQDPPWKKTAPPSRFSAVGFRVLTSYGTSTGPEENSSFLASCGCCRTPSCGKASVLDRPAPSMSRGVSAAHHRRWAAYAMSLGLRVQGVGSGKVWGLGLRV